MRAAGLTGGPFPFGATAWHDSGAKFHHRQRRCQIAKHGLSAPPERGCPPNGTMCAPNRLGYWISQGLITARTRDAAIVGTNEVPREGFALSVVGHHLQRGDLIAPRLRAIRELHYGCDAATGGEVLGAVRICMSAPESSTITPARISKRDSHLAR